LISVLRNLENLTLQKAAAAKAWERRLIHYEDLLDPEARENLVGAEKIFLIL
jgi:hypothetical protein